MKLNNPLSLGLFLASLLAGCGSTGGSSSPLIPDKVIQLTAKSSISLANLATGALIAGVIHLYYDPLAPNWEIEESKLNDDTYRFAMKMKRYHTGGAGESIQILKRRASQLQYEQGFAGYQIVEYTEGIDSQTIGARRVAEGTIRLVQRQQADSFLQN
uniref:Lipoprotein n=1 Tax=Dechloromonas aromatica (strain RCB) TaxID=159087 RepID=Q47I15_DECAR